MSNVEKPYPLAYLPLTYCIGGEPRTSPQSQVLESLQEHLGKKVEIPQKETPPHLKPRVVIVFGNGKPRSETNSFEIHRSCPKPTPLFLLLNTVPQLPEALNRFEARKELVEGACHCGIVFEGQKNPQRALWISTQGNYQLIEGSLAELCQNAAQRIQIHFASPNVSTRYDGGFQLPWRTWARSPLHPNISRAAHELGDARIIDNEVDLTKYTPNRLKAMLLARAFNNNNKLGIGESMRSELGPVGVIGVTRSGGKKVEVDPNPKKGHITPVWAITPDGYMIPDVTRKPKLSRLLFSDFANGSVETHENGLIRLINSLARAGIISDFEGALSYIQRRFNKEQFIPIQPSGLPISSAVSVDHAHWHVKRAYDHNIKVGEPDFRYFPKLDFSCGSRHAAWALISGLMQFEEFLRAEGLSETIIFINLPGHGYVAVGENRQKLTEAIIKGVELKEPEPA